MRALAEIFILRSALEEEVTATTILSLASSGENHAENHALNSEYSGMSVVGRQR